MSALTLSYAALALHEDGLCISEDKLARMVASAGVSVSDIDSRMFAKAFRNVDMDALIAQALSELAGPVHVDAPVKVDAPVQDAAAVEDQDEFDVCDIFAGDDDEEAAIDNLFGDDEDY